MVSVLNSPSSARGAGTPIQCAPRSVVRTIEVQGGEAQDGGSPKAYPNVGDTNVTDAGWKPTGTGPPAGSAAAVVAE